MGYNRWLLPQPNCWHPEAHRTPSLQPRQDHVGLATENLPVVMFQSQGELQLTPKSTNTAKDGGHRIAAQKAGQVCFVPARQQLEEDESLKPVLQGLRDTSRIGVRSAGRDLGSPSCPGRE